MQRAKRLHQTKPLRISNLKRQPANTLWKASLVFDHTDAYNIDKSAPGIRSLRKEPCYMMSRTKKLVICGLLIAIVAVATILIKIPTVIGYANAGDGFILIASMLVGPLAGLVGGIGSALADLILGYTVYAPATFVIKGLIGLAGGYLIRGRRLSLRNLLVFIVCELWMVAGYFLFETILYGVHSALGSVLPNLGQAAVGVLIAAIAAPALKHLKL